MSDRHELRFFKGKNGSHMLAIKGSVMFNQSHEIQGGCVAAAACTGSHAQFTMQKQMLTLCSMLAKDTQDRSPKLWISPGVDSDKVSGSMVVQLLRHRVTRGCERFDLKTFPDNKAEIILFRCLSYGTKSMALRRRVTSGMCACLNSLFSWVISSNSTTS